MCRLVLEVCLPVKVVCTSLRLQSWLIVVTVLHLTHNVSFEEKCLSSLKEGFEKFVAPWLTQEGSCYQLRFAAVTMDSNSESQRKRDWEQNCQKGYRNFSHPSCIISLFSTTDVLYVLDNSGFASKRAFKLEAWQRTKEFSSVVEKLWGFKHNNKKIQIKTVEQLTNFLKWMSKAWMRQKIYLWSAFVNEFMRRQGATTASEIWTKTESAVWGMRPRWGRKLVQFHTWTRSILTSQ